MRERTKRRLKRYWRNFKQVRLYILVRFLIILGMSTVLSTVATILNFNNILLTTQSMLLTGLTGFCIFFLFFDIIIMRRDYYRLTHKRKYRMVNYISHGMFAVINIAASYLIPNTYFYAFVFSITKFARYSHFGITPLLSAIIFNVIVMISVHFAPLGMKWLHMHHG